MSEPFPKWLRLPSQVALLLGLSALSATTVQADAGREASSDAALRAQAERMNPGDVVIRTEAGRLFVSEHGSPAAELRLSDTAEARHLRQLLEQHEATSGVRLDRIILAGGGGKGISWGHWKPVNPPRTENPTKAGGSARTGLHDNTRETRLTVRPDSANLTGSESKK